MESEGLPAVALLPPPPPPPPPPPLPPPPPPPPPSVKGAGLICRGLRRSSRMRNFNWETLPKHSVVGKYNIWTADRTNGEYELDTDHMEELFSHKQDQQQIKPLNRQSLRGLPAAPGGEMVSILSSKRSMNIGIFLKQFKRPVRDMVEEIQSGNGLSFGSGKLRELCKLLPDEREEKELLQFKGDRSGLPDADLFMLMLVNIPTYEERLRSLVLKEEFFPIMGEMKGHISTLTSAGKELLESDHLHSVIRLVLKTGNYMNAGGYAGSAIGFRMASLLKLADTKANKPGMNLMHYVVMQSQKADLALLEFPQELKHIEAASRMNKGDIEAEYERQGKRIQDAKGDTLKQEDLKTQMEDFLQEAEVCLAKIEADLKELQVVSDSVAEYFCEDPNKFKLDACCSVFNEFCKKFKRAMQENKAREVGEVQRRHRERLNCAAKRRSTATCSSRDKEMDGVALESVLQSFLTKRLYRRRSGRPSSSHGSPTGGSPKNGSLSEITAQGNLPANQSKGGLFTDLVVGKKEWNSAGELTEKCLQKKLQSNSEDIKDQCALSNEEKMRTTKKEDSRGSTPLVSRLATISSLDRSFSATSDDTDDELQDNNEEEAQKLREASRKVLRFQNSRSSVSSAELDNQKSPRITLPRQRTFDEETQMCPKDTSNEDLELLFGSQPSSKRNLGRRNTLPSKVPKTEEERGDQWAQRPVKSSESATADKHDTLQTEGTGSNHSNQVFDFSNVSKVYSQGPDSPLAEKKPSASRIPDEGLVEQNREGTSVDPTDVHMQRNSGNPPPKSTWIKTESSGLFFNFFKRLGDMSKLQSSKESVHKGFDSGT